MRKRIYGLIEFSENENPSEAKYDIYDIFMIICIAASIVPLFFKESNRVFQVIEYATSVVFVADYILRWITADLKMGKSGVIPFLRYPFTPFALFDLLSVLPSLSILAPGFRLFRLFRLNKAFRALRLLRYSRGFNMILAVARKQRQSLITVVFLAMGYIILSALIVFQVEPESFRDFFDALYWAVVTLTTVGYGDLYPTSDVGRVVGMISSLVGIAIVALPTGIISAGYIRELNNADREKESRK